MKFTTQFLLAGALAMLVSSARAAGEDNSENWKQVKLMEIKGQVADRVQHRGWNLCLVKAAEGEPKEILLANLPYDSKKTFESWQANLSPGPAIQRLEGELSARRVEYVAAVNSGAADRVEAATKALEATKEQLSRMRDLSAPDTKDDGFMIRARPTGQSYENLEIWDCGSQKELDAAYAVALKARKEQDARLAEAKSRLKSDQELAAKDDADGIFKMAERYYLGDRLAGVSRDLAKAHALYEKAAAMGHPDAAVALKHWKTQAAPTR
jgi:TPR repeat protein